MVLDSLRLAVDVFEVVVEIFEVVVAGCRWLWVVVGGFRWFYRIIEFMYPERSVSYLNTSDGNILKLISANPT